MKSTRVATYNYALTDAEGRDDLGGATARSDMDNNAVDVALQRGDCGEPPTSPTAS